MPRKKRNYPIVLGPDPKALQQLVVILNEGMQPERQLLRELVAAWFASGPNVRKLFADLPKLGELAQDISAGIFPTNFAQASLIVSYIPTSLSDSEPEAFAYSLFLRFLVNPYNRGLGGPCKKCGRYFFKETDRKFRAFCESSCGSRFYSRRANKQRRAGEATQRLKNVKLAIKMWPGMKSKYDCVEWIQKETHVSKRWISGAIKSGEIAIPTRNA